MPRATTSMDTVRYQLKSAPPDGWVDIRPMDYGTYLKRRDMAMKMGVTGAGSGFEKIDLDILQETVTRFEFKSCIVDHNLENEEGKKLNLSTPEDFQRLDPRIGQELSILIDEVTQWEDTKSDEGAEGGDRTDDSISEDSQP